MIRARASGLSFLRAKGTPLDPFKPVMIGVEELKAALHEQRETLYSGDILCVHTGWVDQYRALGADGREGLAKTPASAGLRGDEAMARFLWDAHVAALCCDNPAVEPIPGDPAVGSLHRRVLPLLGLALGEFFDFQKLTERCRAANRWSFFFVAAPLKLSDGIGSPGNALAIL